MDEILEKLNLEFNALIDRAMSELMRTYGFKSFEEMRSNGYGFTIERTPHDITKEEMKATVKIYEVKDYRNVSLKINLE